MAKKINKHIKDTRIIQRNEAFAKLKNLPTLRTSMDLNKQYWELSGYKQLSERFKPEWFTPARNAFERNKGKYTKAPFGSVAYKQFWIGELDRLKNGYTSHGFFCPGDLYFWLNYYRLPVIAKDENGKVTGREEGFPMFWEVHYIFAHIKLMAQNVDGSGKDLVCLKPRGVGFSEYQASSGCATYTAERRSVSLYCASNISYLTSDGIMSKVGKQLNFLNQETQRGFKRLRMKKSTPLHYRSSKVDKEGNESGFLSEIIGKVIDSPDKLRGIRTNYLVFEEAGSFKNLLKTIQTAKALMEIGGEKFGFSIAFGTGGDESSGGEALEGLKKVFSNPDTYNFFLFRNKYNEARELRETGFFFATYDCQMKFMNSQGITDLEESYKYIMAERKKYEDAGDVKGLIDLKAEYPLYPEECFMAGGTNVFDRIILGNQKVRLMNDPNLPFKPVRGYLQWTYKKGTQKITGVEFVEDPNGMIAMIEPPETDRDGGVYKNLYIAGIDSIDVGSENSLVGEDGSKFCMVVKKRYLNAAKTHDLYVAYYLERPTDERIAYETSLKLAMFYNAQCNVERTKKEVISWYRQHKKLNKYIVKQPSILANDVSTTKTANVHGTPINEKIISHYIARIKSYIVDFGDNIWFPEMLEQLLNYSDEMKTKYDFVAAMGMCELLDEECDAIAILPTSVISEERDYRPWGYFTNAEGYKEFGPIPEEKNSAADEYAKLGLEVPKDPYADIPTYEELQEQEEAERAGLKFTNADDTSFMDEITGKSLNLQFDD